MDTLTVRIPANIHDFDYLAVNGIGLSTLLRHGRRPPGKKTAAREARKAAKRPLDAMRVPYRLLGQPAERLVEHFYSPMIDRDTADCDRLRIYICSCDAPGCWSFSTRARLEGDQVVWDLGSELGEFRFDRRQYQEALAQARGKTP
jgi:hypothetical protein